MWYLELIIALIRDSLITIFALLLFQINAIFSNVEKIIPFFQNLSLKIRGFFIHIGGKKCLSKIYEHMTNKALFVLICQITNKTFLRLLKSTG